MANYENVNEQTESFDGNYGQRFLSANRQAKIVSPMNNVGQGFNYSKAISKYQKRENEDSISKTANSNDSELTKKSEDSNSSKSGGSKIKDGLIDKAAKRFLPAPLRGLGKSVAGGLTNGSGGLIGALIKGKKTKIYLIAGAAVFGIFFLFALFYSVFAGGGSTASGINFNDVSDYELENTSDTGTTATDTTTPDTTTDTTSSTKPALE